MTESQRRAGSPDGDGDENEDERGDRPTIVAVDNEERVVQAFELWLGDTYRVATATSGTDALELIDEAVDLVLLDRHMPGMSGDAVLTEIRERGYDTRVAMVTAVDPDFDIVSMSFDHYVSKPVDAPELRAVVERLLAFDAYEQQLNELYTILQKIETLEGQKPEHELRTDERYVTLLDRRDALRAKVDDAVASLDRTELARLLGVDDGR